MIERLLAMLESGKDSALLRFGLGNELLKCGDAPAAITHLKSAVAQQPGYSAAWKLLGRAYASADDATSARAAYENGIAAATAAGDKQAAKEMQVFLRRLEKPAI
jgi:predicted Zn-dependent protease